MLRVLSVPILPHQYFVSRQLILYSAVPFGAMVRSCTSISTHCPRLLLVGCLLIIYLQDTRPVSELCKRVSNAEQCGCKAVRASFHKSLVSCIWPPQAKFMLCQLNAVRVTGRKESTVPGESGFQRKGVCSSELLTPFFLFRCLPEVRFSRPPSRLCTQTLGVPHSCTISNCG